MAKKLPHGLATVGRGGIEFEIQNVRESVMHPYFKQALEKFLSKKTRSNEVVRLLDEDLFSQDRAGLLPPRRPQDHSYGWPGGGEIT